MRVGAHLIPLVPAAILFDLPVATARPDASWGQMAAEMASGRALGGGRVGAGAGARVALASGSASPGGVGNGLHRVGAYKVGALVVVNAFGSVVDPSNGKWVVGGPPVLESEQDPLGHTTLVVVATDHPLDKAACGVVARMAAAGLARTLVPAFAPIDGDTVIVASTGGPDRPGPSALTRVGHAAALAVADAVLDAVRVR